MGDVGLIYNEESQIGRSLSIRSGLTIRRTN